MISICESVAYQQKNCWDAWTIRPSNSCRKPDQIILIEVIVYEIDINDRMETGAILLLKLYCYLEIFLP